MPNIISIQKKENQLVVDSRLIAQELGIEHKNFVETIRKHLETIENAFGRVSFKTYLAETPTGGVREYFSHYWLNEDQATFVMTLSRNTEQVIQCKVNLVKSFSEAKEKLKQQEPEPLNNVYIKRLTFSTNRIALPQNYWCIFDEVSKLMRFLETHFEGEISRFDLVDGSVGIRWGRYRKSEILSGKDWPQKIKDYNHPFPDRRGSRKAKCYHVSELPYFRMWYQGKYIPHYLWMYLEDKYEPKQVKLVEAKYKRNLLVGIQP